MMWEVAKLAILSSVGMSFLLCRAVQYSSYYAATDHNYKDFARQNYLGSANGFIKKYNLHRIENRTTHYLECLRHCLLTPNCNSFVIIKDSVCVLNSLNRCKSYTTLLYNYPGCVTYDVIAEEEFNQLNQTCFSKCLTMAQSCTECGRDLCVGSSCEICPKVCWEMTNKTTSLQVKLLWLTMAAQKPMHCDGVWELINLYLTSGRVYAESDLRIEASLILKLTVEYSNGMKFESYFDSFKSHGDNTITVGNYLGGDAGNFWQAPFTERQIVSYNDTNCKAFYYANSTDCTANGVMSYEDQMAANASAGVVKGFSWTACNDAGSSYIEQILLFVTDDAYLEQYRNESETLESC